MGFPQRPRLTGLAIILVIGSLLLHSKILVVVALIVAVVSVIQEYRRRNYGFYIMVVGLGAVIIGLVVWWVISHE